MINLCTANLLALFGGMLFCFKSEAFSEEKEWRIVELRLSPKLIYDLQFRISGGHLIPYVDLDLTTTQEPFSGRLSIARVVHGPTLNPALSKQSVELLLRKHGYDDTEVVGSGVPLRYD
jgi:hypothetical protein